MAIRVRLILMSAALLLAAGMMVGCAEEKKPEPVPVFVETTVVEPLYYNHTVRYSGETLGIIAMWYTKKMENWKQIQEVNPELDVRRMSIGQDIRIPDYLVEEDTPLPKSYVERFVKRAADPEDADAAQSMEEPVQPIATKEPEIDAGETDSGAAEVDVEEVDDDAFLDDLLAEDEAGSDADAAAGAGGAETEAAAAADAEPASAAKAEGGQNESEEPNEDEVDRAKLLEELLE